MCMAHEKTLYTREGQSKIVLQHNYFPYNCFTSEKKAVTCILRKVVKLLPHKEILRFLLYFRDGGIMVTKSMVYRLIAEAIL